MPHVEAVSKQEGTLLNCVLLLCTTHSSNWNAGPGGERGPRDEPSVSALLLHALLVYLDGHEEATKGSPTHDTICVVLLRSGLAA
jgi:hypothetical protein